MSTKAGIIFDRTFLRFFFFFCFLFVFFLKLLTRLNIEGIEMD